MIRWTPNVRKYVFYSCIIARLKRFLGFLHSNYSRVSLILRFKLIYQTIAFAEDMKNNGFSAPLIWWFTVGWFFWFFFRWDEEFSSGVVNWFAFALTRGIQARELLEEQDATRRKLIFSFLLLFSSLILLVFRFQVATRPANLSHWQNGGCSYPAELSRFIFTWACTCRSSCCQTISTK